ncbi:MAG: 6-pyruvoyl-tetrahydropterin synthase-related protein [Chloroflexota bacterium]
MTESGLYPSQTIPTEALPLWMRQARQSVDWGILIVLFFSLMAAWPLLLQEGVPRTNAAENHVYMAADYAQAFREGRLYPRWSAAAVHGYGAPIPHYYPPGLPYTIAAVESLLMPQNSALAARLVMTAAVLLAGSMTYVLVMRFAGATAGVIAALLYVYAPYVGLTAPHILGDYPALLGLALLPALLWSVGRCAQRDHPLDSAILAFITAALLLVDPRLAAAGAGLSLILLVWYGVEGAALRRLVRLIVAAALGIALAAFYWWPALMERDLVIWEAQEVTPLPLRLSFPAIISPADPVDLNALLPRPQLTIGAVSLIFSLLGVLATWLHWQRMSPDGWLSRLRALEAHTRLHALFLLTGLVLVVGAVVLAPAAVWLLGPIALCLAVGGSAAVHLREWLPPELKRLALPVLMIVLLSGSSAVWLPPRWESRMEAVGVAAQVAYEAQGYGVAVLPPGAPVPLTVPQPVIVNRALTTSYLEGRPLRVPNLRLTGEKRADLLASDSHRDHYLVTAQRDVVFDLLRASFPGWQATLAGRPTRLERNPANGLMIVNVPETRNTELFIRLGPTPPRRTGWLISGAALLLVLLPTGIRLLRYEADDTFEDLQYMPRADARLTGLVCAGFAAAVLVFAVQGGPLTLYPRPGYGLDNHVALRARTDAGIEAIAYRLQSGDTDVRLGESLDFTLAWRVNSVLLDNLRVQVYLQRADSPVRWQLSEPRAPGGYPTRRWQPGRYVLDPHTIPLTTVIPGEYRIAVELIPCTPECQTTNRVTFFDRDGSFIGQTLLLPPRITVHGSGS